MDSLGKGTMWQYWIWTFITPVWWIFSSHACERLHDFISGDLPPFGENTFVKKDKIYESLVTSDEHDGIAKTTLAVIFPALCLVSKKLFKDHLDGGKIFKCWGWYQGKMLVRAKNQQVVESVFGALDQLMRSKPNIATVSCEAYKCLQTTRPCNGWRPKFPR